MVCLIYFMPRKYQKLDKRVWFTPDIEILCYATIINLVKELFGLAIKRQAIDGFKRKISFEGEGNKYKRRYTFAK